MSRSFPNSIIPTFLLSEVNRKAGRILVEWLEGWKKRRFRINVIASINHISSLYVVAFQYWISTKVGTKISY